jgi:hypothetical protein
MGKWKTVISTAKNGGVDYTGETIRNWTVLGLASNPGAPTYKHKWKCVCSCGVEQNVDKQNLLKGCSAGCSFCKGKRYSGENGFNWKGFGSIPMVYYSRIKKHAAKLGMSVFVSIEDIDQLWKDSEGKCALTGLPIRMGEDASLDRIDSSKSYEKGNLQWVHKHIQLMKSALAQDYFVKMCRMVSEHSKLLCQSW